MNRPIRVFPVLTKHADLIIFGSADDRKDFLKSKRARQEGWFPALADEAIVVGFDKETGAMAI